MHNYDRWIFTAIQLVSTPTRRCGMSYSNEQCHRQHAAVYIQKLGHNLHLPVVCVNTAVIFMHRFFMHHPLSDCEKAMPGRFFFIPIGAAALFLASKVEDEPRKLEHFVNAIQMMERRPVLKVGSPEYKEAEQYLLDHEMTMLMSLGFDLHVTHPHKTIITTAVALGAPKDLVQMAYFMGTDLNVLSTLALQYSPDALSCLCIYLASKYCKWHLPTSSTDADGNSWLSFAGLTEDKLISMSANFWTAYKATPVKIAKRTIFAKCHPVQGPSVFQQALKVTMWDRLFIRRRGIYLHFCCENTLLTSTTFKSKS